MNRVLFSKATDEWETPQDLFDRLNDEFKFTLDAAATWENTKVRNAYWDAESDALTQSWSSPMSLNGEPHRVWLNPPYSRCREFIAKASQEAYKGCTVVCLVPSRTDTRWWHEHVWDASTNAYRPGVEVRFLRGRLKFGTSQNSAPFPSVVIIFRPA